METETEGVFKVWRQRECSGVETEGVFEVFRVWRQRECSRCSGVETETEGVFRCGDGDGDRGSVRGV